MDSKSGAQILSIFISCGLFLDTAIRGAVGRAETACQHDVPADDEANLEAAVARQPISVAIDAGGLDFQLYSRGIFTGACGHDLNHGVAAVGYGAEGQRKYWIVKNSWGRDWGEDGYVRMLKDSRDRRGVCGIAMDASYPVKG